jgi:hypothetical protein
MVFCGFRGKGIPKQGGVGQKTAVFLLTGVEKRGCVRKFHSFQGKVIAGMTDYEITRLRMTDDQLPDYQLPDDG